MCVHESCGVINVWEEGVDEPSGEPFPVEIAPPEARNSGTVEALPAAPLETESPGAARSRIENKRKQIRTKLMSKHVSAAPLGEDTCMRGHVEAPRRPRFKSRKRLHCETEVEVAGLLTGYKSIFSERKIIRQELSKRDDSLRDLLHQVLTACR